MSGIRLGMHEREEALGQLVGFTFADLIGFNCHQRVVPALSLHRHADSADRPRKLTAAGLLLAWRQCSSEELSRASQDLVRRQMGPMEILQTSPPDSTQCPDG